MSIFTGASPVLVPTRGPVFCTAEPASSQGVLIPKSLFSGPPSWAIDRRSGCIIVSANGELLHSILGMEHLLAKGALHIEGNHLISSSRRNRSCLGTFLQAAVSSHSWIDLLLGAHVDVPPTLFVRGRTAREAGPPAVVLMMRDFSAAIRDVPNLSAMFGLTASEFHIVSMLIAGKSIAAIAECNRNSILTVRTHLKRSYVKLGISSKEQLFSMALRLMAD